MLILLPESKDKIEVESIIKVTDSSLILRRYLNLFYGDYFGTFTGLLSVVFGVFIFAMEPGGMPVFSEVPFLIPFFGSITIILLFVWRRSMPICFNRETQMVSYWDFGVLYQKKWEDINFYIKTIASTKGNINVLAFELRGGRKIIFDKTLYLKMYDDYIVQYMNREETRLHKETLSYMKLANFEYKFSEIFLNILPKKISFSMVLFSPLLIFEIPLYYVMFILNKILPRRKIPKELLKACGCKENEKIYG